MHLVAVHTRRKDGHPASNMYSQDYYIFYIECFKKIVFDGVLGEPLAEILWSITWGAKMDTRQKSVYTVHIYRFYVEFFKTIVDPVPFLIMWVTDVIEKMIIKKFIHERNWVMTCQSFKFGRFFFYQKVEPQTNLIKKFDS